MIEYSLATRSDDAVLREMLRDNAMPSWVSMAVTREPSFFAGTGRFGRDWEVVARQDGAPVGMCSVSEQPIHFNGAPASAGYLGCLRINRPYRNRLRILRDGFRAVRRFSPAGGRAVWFTAIAAENEPARRILEARLPGMPVYRAANDVMALAMSSARGRRRSLWSPMAPADLAEVCDFHNRHVARYQFSPVLTPDSALRTGASFFVARQSGELGACMALWNQQSYRQLVPRAYREPLGMLRPVYNAYARVARRVELPPVDQPLDQVHLAFLAVCDSREGEMPMFVEHALSLAGTRVVTLGLHDSHPWLDTLIRKFRPTIYRTRIYTVEFDGPTSTDGRPAQPEAAIL